MPTPSSADRYPEVRVERPEPLCCATGRLGWDACPREWVCPGVPPLFRVAHRKRKAAAGLGRNLSGQTAHDPVYAQDEANRLEFLRHLKARTGETGGPDPGLRP